jgi:hypothetical protein
LIAGPGRAILFLESATGRHRRWGPPSPRYRAREGRDLAVGGQIFRQRAAGTSAAAAAPAVDSSHTYELRRTTEGWLLLVDDKLVKQCNTLPEANLALIAARAGDTPARSRRLARRSRS